MVAPDVELKNRALRLLSGREYSRLELERKLAGFEKAPGALAATLDALQAKGFISEQRVLESVINRRAAKLGSMRIKQELQAKGLDAQAIAAAVRVLRASDLERAAQVWRKRFASVAHQGDASPAASAAERSRQMRFLATRGFTTETIRRVLEQTDEDP